MLIAGSGAERLAEERGLELCDPSWFITDRQHERWLASLETLLLDKGLVTPEELDARTAEYASGERDDDWDPDHHHPDGDHHHH